MHGNEREANFKVKFYAPLLPAVQIGCTSMLVARADRANRFCRVSVVTRDRTV
ncbi:MAG: hypothetical protein P2A85_11485 [Microcoleus anatoxicus]|uniref:hypothetical protein n=1 Tax=Microcoleus anatoxicus TaxID=2705319 RepID=UPI003670939F